MWGQLSGWYKQTVYDPTASLSAERRGTLSMPDIESAFPPGTAKYSRKVPSPHPSPTSPPLGQHSSQRPSRSSRAAGNWAPGRGGLVGAPTDQPNILRSRPGWVVGTRAPSVGSGGAPLQAGEPLKGLGQQPHGDVHAASRELKPACGPRLKLPACMKPHQAGGAGSGGRRTIPGNTV